MYPTYLKRGPSCNLFGRWVQDGKAITFASKLERVDWQSLPCTFQKLLIHKNSNKSRIALEVVK